ncbi:MAG TPA: hypothetical protein VF397_10470 [Pyrinomonadaceae bacterium]
MEHTKTKSGKDLTIALLLVTLVLLLAVELCARSEANYEKQFSASPRPRLAASDFEYLWYEAENMRGITETSRHEPQLNPSYLEIPAAKAPGWSISGPGVSAEWSQGGESEWNSVAASADETHGTIWQDIEIPRAGEYKVWLRYADWANKSESFVVRITQSGLQSREGVSMSMAPKDIFRHEFGATDIVDPHNETSMYWGWAFTWDGAPVTLAKGSAHVSIEITKAAQARRQVDCFLLTSDLSFIPEGRRKPDFAAMRYLRDWSAKREAFASLIDSSPTGDVSPKWSRPKVAGRDFLLPWNIAKEFWQLYDKPAAERPLYPFNAEPIAEFVKMYAGKRDVPIFNSKLIAPVIYINDLPELLKDGSAFRRYLAETKVPFAVLINYGSAKFASDAEAQAVWKLLNGELRDQFLGWISGESVGFVWDESPRYLNISPNMSRTQLLEAHRQFYTDALARKWSAMFKTQTGAMWEKMLPAQSTSSTSFAHPLSAWGVRFLGVETAAVQPMTAMRLAFTRGAARQYGGEFFYYHAPNFGDTATTFTKQQNFAGPDNFFHSRYGATMGPSLSWYRKSYYLYYMSGASAIYLEQGFDQFFRPGPGEHPFQLNPLGRITDEFVSFAAKHPDRGEPYTPIAFLLDPAHGWEMTDYPQWPFEVSQINRGDRALRELFGAVYYPGPVREGEPASGERQAFVPGVFGNIFDVLVSGSAVVPTALSAAGAKERATPINAIGAYRAIVVGGEINWTPAWINKLQVYVRSGGVLVLNAAQVKGLPSEILGVRFTGETGEAHNAMCLSPNEPPQELHGGIFRFDEIELKGAQALITTPSNRPLVTINKVGLGQVVLVGVRDFLGEDERLPPFVAHLLVHLAADATPVHVDGDVEYLVDRNSRGWVVTLFNDNGVFKPQQGLSQVDPSASVQVKLSLRGAPVLRANEWTSDQVIAIQKQVNQPDSVTVNIAPGGVAVVELVTAR